MLTIVIAIILAALAYAILVAIGAPQLLAFIAAALVIVAALLELRGSPPWRR